MKKTVSKIKPKRGAPSKTKSIDLLGIKFLIEKGCTDFEICSFYKITRTTFWRMQKSNPELCNTLKEWKKSSNERVERSLFERACGYSHESEEVFCAFGKVTRVKTIKQYPPDPLSCIMWLKNRMPDQWREKPPEAPDERFKDAELVFHNVPNQKDAKTEQRFAKFYDQN